MQETGIMSAGSTKKTPLSNLINSLRWRQMVSSLAIIATGITASGFFYYEIKSQSSFQTQGDRMISDALLIINSIELHENLNLFILGEHVRENNFRNKLTERGFTGPLTETKEKEKEYYAYIQDIKKQSIFWSSKHPNERPINQTSPYSSLIKRDFSTFSFIQQSPSDTYTLKIDKPVTSSGRNPGNSKLTSQTEYIIYSREFSIETSKQFRLVIAKSAAGYKKEKSELARGILGLILATTLFVLIAQFVGSYFVLAPIRRIEKEIKMIESGNKQNIEHDYPSELTPIKSAVNTLINSEKGQKKRYREALDNLAHALKTPLAAIQGASSNAVIERRTNKAYIDDQVQRMSNLVDYHLRRAVVSDHNAIIKLEKLRPIVFRLRESLVKVHFDKQFDMNIDIDEYAKCRVEYDDLMEVFGNLLNNACRFCESKITITATQDVNFLVVDIDDDGMGFPDDDPSELFKRGMRADSKTEGQGIGLAVSAEIIQSAGGKISLLMSPYVGARVRLHLPV